MIFAVTGADAAKKWIRETACDQIARAEEVSKFKTLFKALRSRRGERAVVKATWMNIAFTRRGFEKFQAAGIPQMDAALPL